MLPAVEPSTARLTQRGASAGCLAENRITSTSSPTVIGIPAESIKETSRMAQGPSSTRKLVRRSSNHYCKHQKMPREVTYAKSSYEILRLAGIRAEGCCQIPLRSAGV